MMKWIVAAVVSGAPVLAAAEPVTPTDVSFDDYGSVEESLTGTPGDAANGAAIVGNKKAGNCVACHQVSALSDVPFQGEIGPMLDGAGDRWNEAELRGIVANSKMTFEGSMMPSYYKTAPATALPARPGLSRCRPCWMPSKSKMSSPSWRR